MKKAVFATLAALIAFSFSFACGEADGEGTVSENSEIQESTDTEAAEISRIASFYEEAIAFIASGEIEEQIINQMNLSEVFNSAEVILLIEEAYDRFALNNGFESPAEWREARDRYMSDETIAGLQSELDACIETILGNLPVEFHSEVSEMSRSTESTEPADSDDQGDDIEPVQDGDDNALLTDWEIGEIIESLR